MTNSHHTTVSPQPLSAFGSNHYSQFGEDGVIAKIFEIIGARSRICIEFGAWDGFHLSNTASLWSNGWKGVLIEGHAGRFQDLVRNVRDHDCTCINAYVSRDGDNRLEALLDRHGVGHDIDLLSVDIDGNDYYIIESLDTLRPRVIVCEYNPTIPAVMDLQAEYGNYFGASVAALERIARTKSYRLVALTETNCFFVLEEDFHRFAGYETRLDRIRIDTQLVHVITAYNGDYVLSRNPPYGVNYPYGGTLTGPHVRTAFKPGLMKPLAVLWQRLRGMARSLLRQDG